MSGVQRTAIKFGRVRVHSNAVTQLVARQAETRFERFKAAYEAPIGERFAAVREEKEAERRARNKLRRTTERLRRREYKRQNDGRGGDDSMEARIAQLDRIMRTAMEEEDSSLSRGDVGASADAGKDVTADDWSRAYRVAQRIEDSTSQQELAEPDLEARMLKEMRDANVPMGEPVYEVPFEALRFTTRDRSLDKGTARNKHEEALTIYKERRVTLELNVDALQLPYLVEERLIELVGVRYNPETGDIKLSCDKYKNKAQNKHALFVTLQALLSDAFAADSNYIPIANKHDLVGDMQAHEVEWTNLMKQMGVNIDPLRLGPALAPATYLNLLKEDIITNDSVQNVRDSHVEPLIVRQIFDEESSTSTNVKGAWRMFHFERFPSKAQRADAKNKAQELLEQIKK